MLVALVTIGVLVIAFGVLVLLRFPDRPGGEIEFQGVRVQAASAGLPLIVIGLVTVVIAALQFESESESVPGVASPGDSTSRPTAGETPATPTTSSTWTPGPRTSTAPTSADSGACLDDHLDRNPKVDKDFRTELLAGQAKVRVYPEVDIALILMEGIDTTGAVRLKYTAVSDVALAIYEVVDASCRPGTFQTQEDSHGFQVRMVLSDRTYDLVITYEEEALDARASLTRVG